MLHCVQDDSNGKHPAYVILSEAKYLLSFLSTIASSIQPELFAGMTAKGLAATSAIF